jgi:hypothetical protein
VDWDHPRRGRPGRTNDLRHFARRISEAHEAWLESKAAAHAYEQGREAWIDEHGSDRLKRAVERGYKHDGICRDERMATELPGFISFAKKRNVREIMNPSEEALEIEREVLELVERNGMTDVSVRLVWVPAESPRIAV